MSVFALLVKGPSPAAGKNHGSALADRTGK